MTVCFKIDFFTNFAAMGTGRPNELEVNKKILLDFLKNRGEDNKDAGVVYSNIEKKVRDFYIDSNITDVEKMYEWFIRCMKREKILKHKMRTSNDSEKKYWRNKLYALYSSGREKNKSARIKFYEKTKNVTHYKIRRTISTRLIIALKHQNINRKTKSSISYLGCSLGYFKKYIERQFKPGMTWDNHGKWHIDHKLPCCSFDLSKEGEVAKCFNYKNLQPLWKGENLSKIKTDKKLSLMR